MFFIRQIFLLIVSVAFLFLGGGMDVLAKPPKQPRLVSYSQLWMASPFTIKPSIEAQAISSPLEKEWSLGSIRPSKFGYSVTLINKKNRKNRVRFIPGFSSGEFKLLEVRQNAQNPKKSKVYVSKGGQKAWIGYDKKIVKLHIGRKSASKFKRGKKTFHGRKVNPRQSPPIPTRSGSNRQPVHRVRYVPRH